MTKSNVLGYVAAFPIPEVLQGINAFARGARSVNPKAEVRVIWVNSWYDPGKEREAANTLMSQGADIVTHHTDSTAVVQAAEEKGKYAFGYHSDMSKYGPKAHLTATTHVWGDFYAKTVNDVIGGTWKTDQRLGRHEGRHDQAGAAQSGDPGGRQDAGGEARRRHQGRHVPSVRRPGRRSGRQDARRGGQDDDRRRARQDGLLRRRRRRASCRRSSAQSSATSRWPRPGRRGTSGARGDRRDGRDLPLAEVSHGSVHRRLAQPARPLAAPRQRRRLDRRVLLFRDARQFAVAAEEAGGREARRVRRAVGGPRRRLLQQPEVPDRAEGRAAVRRTCTGRSGRPTRRGSRGWGCSPSSTGTARARI